MASAPEATADTKMQASTRKWVAARGESDTICYTLLMENCGSAPSKILVGKKKHTTLRRDGKKLPNPEKITNGPGNWVLPGGRGNASETMIAGCVREFFEETGYQLGTRWDRRFFKYFPDGFCVAVYLMRDLSEIEKQINDNIGKGTPPDDELEMVVRSTVADFEAQCAKQPKSDWFLQALKELDGLFVR